MAINAQRKGEKMCILKKQCTKIKRTGCKRENEE